MDDGLRIGNNYVGYMEQTTPQFSACWLESQSIAEDNGCRHKPGTWVPSTTVHRDRMVVKRDPTCNGIGRSIRMPWFAVREHSRKTTMQQSER